MDHLEQHLRERIESVQEAIHHNERYAAVDRGFVEEFRLTAPEIADLYRQWEQEHQEKIAFLKEDLRCLQLRLVARSRGSEEPYDLLSD